jgi:hypothetical protein
MNQTLKPIVLFAVLFFSVYVFMSCGELAYKMENISFFDYANFRYITAVITMFSSVAVAFLTLMELHKWATTQIKLLRKQET